MVDKRSLRSSKKDADPPAEDDKPKPTRTRSARGKKAKASDAQQTTTTHDTVSSTAPSQSTASEDVVMQTDDTPEQPSDKAGEDVEMKDNAEDEGKDSGEAAPKEDAAPSPLTGTKRLLVNG
jgi:hypothetical protein